MAVQYCELSESDIHQRTRGQQIQPVAVAAYSDASLVIVSRTNRGSSPRHAARSQICLACRMWESPPSDTLQLHASPSCDKGIYVSETDTDILPFYGTERCPQLHLFGLSEALIGDLETEGSIERSPGRSTTS